MMELKGENGKLRVSECVEVYLHTKRAKQVQSHEVRLKLRVSECNANESSFNRTKCG